MEYYLLDKNKYLSREEISRNISALFFEINAESALNKISNDYKCDISDYDKLLNQSEFSFHIIFNKRSPESLKKIACEKKDSIYSWEAVVANYDKIFLGGQNHIKISTKFKNYSINKHFSYEMAFEKYFQHTKHLLVCDKYLISETDFEKTLELNLFPLFESLYFNNKCSKAQDHM